MYGRHDSIVGITRREDRISAREEQAKAIAEQEDAQKDQDAKAGRQQIHGRYVTGS